MFRKDAFHPAQLQSKLWLCEAVEQRFSQLDQIWLYGGWYGLQAFLLLTRNKTAINKITSFDIDGNCEQWAALFNGYWSSVGKFVPITKDCNDIEFKDTVPDLIINTSTEHFKYSQWWDRIPQGQLVALQGNNMRNLDHYHFFQSLEDFAQRFPLSETLVKEEMLCVCSETFRFYRYMLIGRK